MSARVSLRVLVVDEDERMRLIARLMLSADGHAVATAASGEDALAYLAANEVDAVITDLDLGPGMDGWALAERIRARWAAVRVVLATAWGNAVDRAEVRDLGFDAIVGRPHRLDELRRALELP